MTQSTESESRLSISQMAKIFNMTRQTLIHYDHINLFKPAYIDENGYRFYCVCQVAELREITFLKNMGLKLEVIKEIIKKCDPYDFISYLNLQKNYLDEEINRLVQYKHHLEDRLSLLNQLKEKDVKINIPFIEEKNERFYVFKAFPQNETIDHRLIDSTFMRLWEEAISTNVSSLHGYGMMFDQESILNQEFLKKAGIFLIFDHQEVESMSSHCLRAGKYLSMYKYGMPYDLESISYLMKWASDHQLEVEGNALDLCVYDHIYNQNGNQDFCLLQIRLKNE